MASRPFHKPVKAPAKLFGQVKESARPEDPLTITDDTTAWEIYNHRAAEVDGDLLKDWNDNLNTLLIFAALYSGILTSFITETLGLLQEDSAETTRDILLVITRQLANNSVPAFEPTPFTPEAWTIRVNGFFFASIMCSLVVALFAVLALQWVAGYDAGLTTPSPQKRAAQRQLRYIGMERWKLNQVIVSLPLLVFISLFLFFIGMADWLWHIHRSISAIVMAGAAIGAAIYLFTIAISTVWVDAPFRTQTSKTLAVVSREILVWLKMVLIRLPSRIYKEKLITSDLSNSKYEVVEAWRQIRQSTEWPPKTFAKCEEKKVDSVESLSVDSLIWLANSIDVLSSSRNSILILLQEMMELPPDTLIKRELFVDAPWEAIFTMLCKPYFGRKELEDYTPGDLENVAFLCRALSMIFTNIKNEAFEAFYQSIWKTKDNSLAASVSLAYHNYDWAREFPGANLEEGFISACRAIRDLSPDYFHLFLLNIRRDQESSFSRLWISNSAVEALASTCSLTSEAIRNPSSATIIHPRSLDAIFDMLSHIMGETVDQQRTPVSRYVYAMEHGNQDNEETKKEMFHSIVRQMFAHVALVDPRNLNLGSGFENEFPFSTLSTLIKSTSWAPTDNDLEDLIFVMKPFNARYELLQAIVFPAFRTSKTEEKPVEDLMDLIMGFKTILANTSQQSEQSRLALLEYFRDVLYYKRTYELDLVSELDTKYGDRLVGIEDPGLAAILSCSLSPMRVFPALAGPFTSEWKDQFGEEIFRILNSGNIDPDRLPVSLMTLVRTCIAEGTPSLRASAIDFLCDNMKTYYFSEQELRQATEPVLGHILEHYAQRTDEKQPTDLALVLRISGFNWFTQAFLACNGKDRLGEIVSNIHPDGLADASHLLGDQIVFSNLKEDLEFWISCSSTCLQSLGSRYAAAKQAGETNQLTTAYDAFLSSVREILSWALKRSREARNSENGDDDNQLEGGELNLEEIATENRTKFTDEGNPIPLEGRDFDFVSQLSEAEWDAWLNTLSTILGRTQVETTE